MKPFFLSLVHRRALFAGALVLASPAAALADPTADKQACLQASSDGQTLRDAHHLIEARERFRQCAQATCPGIVQRDCAEWFDAADHAVPTVVFDAKDGAGNDLAAVKVTVDGHPLTEKLDGTELAVDPGAHDFTFEVDGQPKVARALVLKEGEKARRVSIQIGATEAPPAAATAAAPTVAPAPAPPPTRAPATALAPTAEPPPAAPAPQKTVGLVVGGVGVLGLATGAVLGILAMSAKNDYERDCGANIGAPSAQDCNQAGVDGRSDAYTKGVASTVFLVGGAAVAATGVILYITAPSARATKVGLGPSGVVVGGEF